MEKSARLTWGGSDRQRVASERRVGTDSADPTDDENPKPGVSCWGWFSAEPSENEKQKEPL